MNILHLLSNRKWTERSEPVADLVLAVTIDGKMVALNAAGEKQAIFADAQEVVQLVDHNGDDLVFRSGIIIAVSGRPGDSCASQLEL